MFIQLGDDYFEPKLIAVVRASGKKTIIFTSGASPIDGGFLVDLPIEDVLEALAQAHLHSALSLLDRASEEDSHPPYQLDTPSE